MSSLCKIQPVKSDKPDCCFLPFGQGFPYISDILPRECGKKRRFRAGIFSQFARIQMIFRLTDDFLRRIFPQTQQIPVILRSRGFIWRRRRDLNSRADFSTYSLSRGAPSPAWVRLHVKLCSCRSISCPLFPQRNLAERVGFIFCGKSTAVAICHRHIAKSSLSNP